MTLSTLEQRRLDLYEQGFSFVDIALKEGATVQAVKTTIWRAKSKLDGTYKAPERKGAAKKSGFTFKEEDMEKVNFIKETYQKLWNQEMSDAELIDQALRSLFSEYKELEQEQKQRQAQAEQEAKERKERAEQAERERKAKAEQKRKSIPRKRGFKYFTGHERTTAEIKKAFRTLSKQLHPDNTETGNEEAFKAMHKEYEKLMN